ncbi:ACP S-malonyltransferase [Neisseria gonorrhoeae]|uniref:Malonyl CoA-acyl carrier protein transacylase n=1 Tax=Neisseria gonorrhoeae (strain ATCC 700825 / FA 1090) TaxID=242231 RepID=Q5F4X7_NEIG1|nr:ACP S-malonyltransferase [Neisseria gonorrhoeae]AAW90760.1 malonyl CoA-ACP transacylase [Neisseria gonorrhoeae FA 1090]KAE9494413.1 malonyl CoA-acyl carrier protein transacylase [Neisseria gonorrhoeae]KAE9497813.1 malonyl CoA-acyl carrier protein transacylase [Neisseria gonorrhoeae]KAE9501618.1 malonyl CoA-acyl carrier protein transacylase [Neisseria gonorrhoeae]KAE9505110.1 malonyl CoA-acyl carrier protein transacylase [Neisseria gonorrhoeae]
MSFAFFFPGQGSQSLGMMNGFAEHVIVKNTFDEASAILGQDLWAMINGSDAEIIGQTVNTQPIMLAAGVAVYRAYLEVGGKTPAAVAGHSLGEYTALVAAEALDFADAVKLVRLRAELMQSAVPQGVGAMAAILGLEDEQVRQICAESAQGEVVEAVNFNSPGQVVIAGNAAAVGRTMAAAKEAGAKRALPLPVSVPSHCSLMKPAADKLAETLKTVEIKQPQIRVIHNADVAAYDDAGKIKDALVRQLYSPVRWTETVNALVSDGIAESAECSPGKVLAGLAKRINKAAACSALTDAGQITAFIEAH